MAFSATLQKTVTRDPVSSLLTSMRVSYVVSATTGFTDKGLFLFQSVDGIMVFQTICSAQHMASYRLGVVDPVTRFVRADNYSVTVDTPDDATELMDSTQSAVAALCRSMAVLRDNVNITTVVISE